MAKKTQQLLMVWVLPLIVLGGIFFPLLGYLVVLMMLTLLILSYYRQRYWCGHLCPRGAFLDLVMNKLSPKKPLPKIFTNQKFRWAILGFFMILLGVQLSLADKNVYSLGFVFVKLCLVTTVIAIVFGLRFNSRAWCAICPMGTLQEKIGSLKRRQHEKIKD